MRRAVIAALLTGMVAGPTGPATAGQGIATKFVEVLVEDIAPGTRYAVEGKLIDVTNNDDRPTRVRIEALVPSWATMRPGYEPIPETAWIAFEPREMDIPPKATVKAKLIVFAPAEEAYSGKRYQVNVHIRQVGDLGGGMSLALMPRFMFSVAGNTAAGKATVTDFPRKRATVTPYGTTGKAEELVVDCPPVTLGNPWDEPMTFDQVQDPADAGKVDRKPGQVPLDPAWIEASPRTVVVPARKKVEVAVRVRIPLKAGIFGKTLSGPLHFRATRKGGDPVDAYNMVTVMVPALVSGTALKDSGAVR